MRYCSAIARKSLDMAERFMERLFFVTVDTALAALVSLTLQFSLSILYEHFMVFLQDLCTPTYLMRAKKEHRMTVAS